MIPGEWRVFCSTIYQIQTNKEAAVTIWPVGSVVVGLWLSFGLSDLSIHLTLLRHVANSVPVLHHFRGNGVLKKKRSVRWQHLGTTAAALSKNRKLKSQKFLRAVRSSWNLSLTHPWNFHFKSEQKRIQWFSCDSSYAWLFNYITKERLQKKGLWHHVGTSNIDNIKKSIFMWL